MYRFIRTALKTVEDASHKPIRILVLDYPPVGTYLRFILHVYRALPLASASLVGIARIADFDSVAGDTV